MYRFYSTLVVPAKVELIRGVLLIVQLSWGDLGSTPFTVWVRFGVILQDLDNIPSLYPVKVVSRSASGMG